MDDSRIMKAKDDFINDLTRSVIEDENIKALALIGSHADGTHRPLSDIDIIVIVADEVAENYMGDDMWLVGDYGILARHSPGRVILENLISLDVTVVRESDLKSDIFDPITRRAVRKAIRPLFDPDNIIQNARFAIGDQEDTLYTFDEGLDKFCFYAVMASFRIKRGEMWLAHDNIYFDMKQILLLLLKAHFGVGKVTWVERTLNTGHPLEEAIWNIFPTSGDPSDLQNSLLEIVRLGIELINLVDPDEDSIWLENLEIVQETISDILRPLN